MNKSLFTVNNKPFFSIGGQLNNSSCFNIKNIKQGFEVAKELGLNTVALPIYWSMIEPKEDRYDYSIIDNIVKVSNEYDFKLVIIWFGSYKNGASQYIPSWVIENDIDYIKAEGSTHRVLNKISPLCKKAKEKDALALRKALEYINKTPIKDKMIALQIENEVGLLGSARDYSPLAEEKFNANIPLDMFEFINSLQDGYIFDKYAANIDINKNWKENFKLDAEEIFSAYYFAKYLEFVAAEARKVTNVPFYINTWTRENGIRIPGTSYPSGGPTSRMIPIYKYFAKTILAISPDLYCGDYDSYMYQCKQYSREDNILYIPETACNYNSFKLSVRAVEDYNLCSLHVFGINMLVDENGQLIPNAKLFKNVVSIYKSISTLLLKYQGTNRIKAIYEMEGQYDQFIEFDHASFQVKFFKNHVDVATHVQPARRHNDNMNIQPIGFVIDAGDGIYYLAGQGFSIVPVMIDNDPTKLNDATVSNEFLLTRNYIFSYVTHGYLNGDNNYIITDYVTGDETDHGIVAEIEAGLIRFKI
jgi:hypothetical protein